MGAGRWSARRRWRPGPPLGALGDGVFWGFEGALFGGFDGWGAARRWRRPGRPLGGEVCVSEGVEGALGERASAGGVGLVLCKGVDRGAALGRGRRWWRPGRPGVEGGWVWGSFGGGGVLGCWGGGVLGGCQQVCRPMPSHVPLDPPIPAGRAQNSAAPPTPMRLGCPSTPRIKARLPGLDPSPFV